MPEIDWEELKRLPMLPGQKPDERVAHLLQMVGCLQERLNACAAGPWHPPEDTPPQDQMCVVMAYPGLPRIWKCEDDEWVTDTGGYVPLKYWWAEIREPKEESDE